jgi:hypothetical protein
VRVLDLSFTPPTRLPPPPPLPSGRRQVLNLSLQMYSCRVVQRALEVCSLERRIALARELQDHAMRCVRDQNGNHVIQKCVRRGRACCPHDKHCSAQRRRPAASPAPLRLAQHAAPLPSGPTSPLRCIECVPCEHLTTMLDTFNGQIVSLSMHSFGCRVVQRILEHCGGTPRYDAVMGEVTTVGGWARGRGRGGGRPGHSGINSLMTAPAGPPHSRAARALTSILGAS